MNEDADFKNSRPINDGDFGSKDVFIDRELKQLKRDDTKIYPVAPIKFIWDNDIREDRKDGWE